MEEIQSFITKYFMIIPNGNMNIKMKMYYVD